MKTRLILLVLVSTISAIATQAQSPLPVGRSQLNFGIGLSEWGVPLYIGVDHSVHKDITVGGELSWRLYDEKYGSTYYHHNIVGIAGNGNYHFNTLLGIPRNWDFYAGLNLGFYVWSSPDIYNGTHSSGLGLGAQIGGRYYFNNKLGINLEFGGGNSFEGGKLGLTVKL